MPAVRSAAPRMSTLTAAGAGPCPASATPRTAPARRPNGTLTKKTQRQDRWSVRNPPISGPTMEASPQVDEKYPCIRARCSSP